MSVLTNDLGLDLSFYTRSGGKTEYLRKLKPTKTIQSKKFSTQLF